MAVTRRGYIFGAFLSSVLSVLVIIISIGTSSWIVSTATAEIQITDSSVNYGLFRGELVINLLSTPTANTLYMTCVPDVGSCAVSCKTNADARRQEVRYLAEGTGPNAACVPQTVVDPNNPLKEGTAVISFTFYVCMLLLLFTQLIFAITTAGLALLNATKNPTEPIFGLPGCLWSNAITACLGLMVLLLFGVYWAVSSWNEHLALTYIANNTFEAGPRFGYSYWIILLAVLCSLTNVGLIQLRKYLLDRDPPPPTIKIEQNSDGTIFLY